MLFYELRSFCCVISSSGVCNSAIPIRKGSCSLMNSPTRRGQGFALRAAPVVDQRWPQVVISLHQLHASDLPTAIVRLCGERAGKSARYIRHSGSQSASASKQSIDGAQTQHGPAYATTPPKMSDAVENGSTGGTPRRKPRKLEMRSSRHTLSLIHI